MCLDVHEMSLEPGLDIDEIEKRLVASAQRYHREERRLSYYLLDVQARHLFFERGFSSIYDFAMELVGLSRRKTQYLLFIARHLEKLPEITDAFDAGEIRWTKVREILKVATPETQKEWLHKAKELNNRELEKLVRKQATSEEFVTLRISLPEGAMNLWVECGKIAERDAECELEPWQVLEQMMAEYLSTYAASTKDLLSTRQETEDEKGIPWEVRQQVVERDEEQCRFPGCSMRAQLGLHHIQFRSRGGDHAPENLITLCAAHHTLIHQHICDVIGRAPDELRWKGPFLDRWSSDAKNDNGMEGVSPTDPSKETQVAETSETNLSATEVEEDEAEATSTSAPNSQKAHLDENEHDDDWAAKDVAAIFDGPRLPQKKHDLSLPARDIISEWCDQKAREMRKRRRFGRAYQRPLNWVNGDGGHEHVFAVDATSKPGEDRRSKGLKS